MGRDEVKAGVLWLLLSVVGEVLVARVPLFPAAGSEEARLIDEAFRFLLYLGVPVFAFVLTALVYAVVRFRGRGPEEVGVPVQEHFGVSMTWLVITTSLAVLTIVTPGIRGLYELRRPEEPDLVVQIAAEQWNWSVTYPEYGVTVRKARVLYLPVGQRVRFEITSRDVLHSFWIPAFRMKVDAVPGQTTVLYATPDREGSYGEATVFRVQCAELCGAGHARMRMKLEVLPPDRFEQVVQELKSAQK